MYQIFRQDELIYIHNYYIDIIMVFPQLNISPNTLKQAGLTDEHIKAFNQANELTTHMLNTRDEPTINVSKYEIQQAREKDEIIKSMETDLRTIEQHQRIKINELAQSMGMFNIQEAAYNKLDDMKQTKLRDYSRRMNEYDDKINEKNIAYRKAFYNTHAYDDYTAISYFINYIVWVGFIILLFVILGKNGIKNEWYIVLLLLFWMTYLSGKLLDWV
jgi:hypothetical protein